MMTSAEVWERLEQIRQTDYLEVFVQVRNEIFGSLPFLYGMITLELNGVSQVCKPGDVVTVEPGTRHAFSSQTGAVIEEISTTHFKNDSFYTDPVIMANKQRKTILTYWMD